MMKSNIKRIEQIVHERSNEESDEDNVKKVKSLSELSFSQEDERDAPTSLNIGNIKLVPSAQMNQSHASKLVNPFGAVNNAHDFDIKSIGSNNTIDDYAIPEPY